MPNLRLSWDEARNIASYLMTLKEKDPSSYAPAPYLNDPEAEGPRRRVRAALRLRGLPRNRRPRERRQDRHRTNTEGSKPLEQMDFALFIKQAKEKDWYSHKGFFEHKLAKPEIFDEGMIKAEGEDAEHAGLRF